MQEAGQTKILKFVLNKKIVS